MYFTLHKDFDPGYLPKSKTYDFSGDEVTVTTVFFDDDSETSTFDLDELIYPQSRTQFIHRLLTEDFLFV